MLGADVACVSDSVLAPKSAAMYTVPLCTAAELGSAWTVVADWSGTADAVAVGRHLRPSFPIETWPAGGDCTKPGGNDAFLQRHLEAGYDTYYEYWDQSCGSYSTQQLANQQAASFSGEYNLLLGDDINATVASGNFAGQLTDTSYVAGMLTDDETDGEIYGQDGFPISERKAEVARGMWKTYPEITMYNGGKTNKNMGTVAGQVDVQGIDLYIAACAPWITGLEPPPLRAAFDYLVNARNNHMPWPTWQYAQGLFKWKGEPPNRAEVLVQAYAVMAAGGKGLMWFQADETIAGNFPDSWNAMAQANWAFRAVRERLRRGDITGQASTTGETIVDMVRSDDALIVPVVPDDFEIVDAFEILVDDTVANQVVDLNYPGEVKGRSVTFKGLSLDAGTPVRLLVFASDPNVRADMSALIAH